MGNILMINKVAHDIVEDTIVNILNEKCLSKDIKKECAKAALSYYEDNKGAIKLNHLIFLIDAIKAILDGKGNDLKDGVEIIDSDFDMDSLVFHANPDFPSINYCTT